MSLPSWRSLRVLGLAVVLALATVLGGLLDRPAALDLGVDVPWWLLAALFAITEAFVLQLGMRGRGEAVSLAEVPVVLGLFLADPPSLLVGRVVGSALVFVLYHRQTALKAFFNTALVGAGCASAVMVFHLIMGEDYGSLGLRAWVAAATAVAIAGLLEGSTLTLVVSWYEGSPPGRAAVRELAFSSLVPPVVSIGGTVAVVALSNGAAALPLAVTGAAALIGYRAFAILSDRHSSLERLYVLSDRLAAAPHSGDVVASVLAQSADLLGANFAEVALSDPRRGPRRWSLRPGEAIRGPDDAAGTLTLPFPPPSSMVVGGDTPDERAFLEARGLSEALVVPLRVDGAVAGHLLVGDRRVEERGFSGADARLLETVANHGSVALRNGQLIERLHFEARHDELTGLPNRLFFRDLLEEGARAAASGARPCAVMVLDFDGFKAINDTLGHQAGDDLLRIVASRLAHNAADDATVARLGGDEFAVLSTRCVTPESAMDLALRLLTVFDDPVAVAGTRLRLGGSLGISLGPRDGLTGSDLLRNADIAMYAAKGGAGGARLFSQEMVEVTSSTLTLASDLRDAVNDEAIGVAVQPLVDLISGQVHSVEVLARWFHPDLGEVAPEAFFAAAERSGQIVALSARVLDQALELARTWLDDEHPVRVAVNLAPRWLADSSLPEQIDAALAKRGVPAHLLCLEITESSVIADPRRAIQTLGRLRAMGVRLSVDDFGTGYSSLTYLSRLPVDQMKIDKSFVQQMHDSPRDRAIVRSIIDLGRNLGLEVVAEGVTDPGTKRALQEMGCGLGQGYLFSKPIDPEAFPELLAVRGATLPLAVRPPVQRDGHADGLTPPEGLHAADDPRQPRLPSRSRPPRVVP